MGNDNNFERNFDSSESGDFDILELTMRKLLSIMKRALLAN